MLIDSSEETVGVLITIELVGVRFPLVAAASDSHPQKVRLNSVQTHRWQLDYTELDTVGFGAIVNLLQAVAGVSVYAEQSAMRGYITVSVVSGSFAERVNQIQGVLATQAMVWILGWRSLPSLTE